MDTGPWFIGDDKEVGNKAASIISALKSEQSGRRARYVRNLELYEGRKMAGYSPHTYYNYSGSDVQGEDSFDDDRLALIRSATCSAVAEIYGKQKPKPQFQTWGATWKVRRKAYKLDRICEGILNQRQDRFVTVWQFMEDAGSEAALQGVACIKVTADRLGKRIHHALRPLPDVWVDPVEGRRPRNLFDREPIDEHTAMKLWPDAKRWIREAKPYDWCGGAGTTKIRASKIIELNYAYHLPDGPDEPGTWVALIGNQVVERGDWTAPSFPYVFLIWEHHRDGFWGAGIGDEGKRQALECGELDYRLMRRQIVASGNRVYVDKNAGVNKEDLIGNDEVTVVEYDGSGGAPPPQESQRIPFSELELSFRQQKVQDFWDSLGLSQVSAAARREANVSSGIAMLTLNETKAGRQIQKAKRYEQAFVDLAHQYVWRLRELKEDYPDLVVEWSGRQILQQIKFDSADPEDADNLSVSVAPASAMPHDPAGRQETAQILYSMGIVSQDQFKELIGWADIENTMGFDTASMDFFDALIDKYLDAEPETWNMMDYYAPDGTIPNKLTVLTKFTQAMFRARLDQMTLPEDEALKAEFNIDLLLRFIRELVQLMKPPPAPPQQAAGPQAGNPEQPAAQQNTPPGAQPQLPAPPKPGPPQLKQAV